MSIFKKKSIRLSEEEFDMLCNQISEWLEDAISDGGIAEKFKRQHNINEFESYLNSEADIHFSYNFETDSNTLRVWLRGIRRKK